jgi:hypothetical protein
MATSERSQAFVPVSAVRNGVITMKSGGYRGVLMCSSVNFALKSADEQQAIISGFQNFLNTLDFSVEIVIHSRKMDIRPYLALLSKMEDTQKTDLMRIQLREYQTFVESFAESTNIMTKTFYVVVPYAHTVSVGGAAAALASFGRHETVDTSTFEEDRVQLEQRMALAASGLESCGVRAIPLGTEELIELLYRSFNPGVRDEPIRLDQ